MSDEIFEKRRNKIAENVYCPHCLQHYHFCEFNICEKCGKSLLIENEYLHDFHLIDLKKQSCSKCNYKQIFSRFSGRFCSECGHEEVKATDFYNFVKISDMNKGIGVEQWNKEMGKHVVFKSKQNRWENIDINCFHLYPELVEADVKQIKGLRRGASYFMKYRLETDSCDIWMNYDGKHHARLKYQMDFNKYFETGSFEKIDGKWKSEGHLFRDVEIDKLKPFDIETIEKEKEDYFEDFWNDSIFKNVTTFEFSPKKKIFFMPEQDKLLTIDVIMNYNETSIGDSTDLKEAFTKSEDSRNYELNFLIGNRLERGKSKIIYPLAHNFFEVRPKRGVIQVTNEDFKNRLKGIFFYSWEKLYRELEEETAKLQELSGTRLGI